MDGSIQGVGVMGQSDVCLGRVGLSSEVTATVDRFIFKLSAARNKLAIVPKISSVGKFGGERNYG